MDVDAEQLIADLVAVLERAAQAGPVSTPPAVPLEEWATRHGLGRRPAGDPCSVWLLGATN